MNTPTISCTRKYTIASYCCHLKSYRNFDRITQSPKLSFRRRTSSFISTPFSSFFFFFFFFTSWNIRVSNFVLSLARPCIWSTNVSSSSWFVVRKSSLIYSVNMAWLSILIYFVLSVIKSRFSLFLIPLLLYPMLCILLFFWEISFPLTVYY